MPKAAGNQGDYQDMMYVIGAILLAAAVFVVVAVLMQNGKSHGLSGSIAGGAETFFGKTKGKSIDRILSKMTTIVAVVFALIVIVLYVVQADPIDQDDYLDDNFNNNTGVVTEATGDGHDHDHDH